MSTSPTLKSHVTDDENSLLNVTFYDASDDSVIGTDISVTNNTNASVTWSGLTQLTTYNWYAKADDGTDTNTSSTWGFTTENVNDPPNTPSNPNPSDDETGVSSDVNIEVDVSDPDGDTMDVTFYDASDDSVIGTDTNVASGGTASISKTFGPLTTFSWYATADDGEYTNVSSTYSFTTQDGPASPSNPSPSDGATDVSLDTFLSVNVTDPDSDTLDVTFFDGSDNFLGNSLNVTNATRATIAWNGLSQGTTYEWYANVSDGEYTNVSPTYDFTTGSAPNTPTNPSPADGATGQGTSPTLTIDVSDPDGDTMDVTFYDASDDSVIDTDSNVADGGTASVSWSNLEQLTTYEWYATADDGGYGTNSSTYDFTTLDVNDAPDEPTTPSPADGAAGVPVNATLSVYVYDEDGDNLDVLFFDSSDDSLIGSANVASGTDATANWTGLSVYMTYGWYATVDDGEFSDTSVMFDFTTGGLDAEEPVEEEEEVVASPVTNSSTVMGKALNGLVTGIFGSETVVALFLLVLLLGVGALFGLVFQIILIALVPVTVVLYASGWLPGAIAFPLLLFIGVIVAFNFFNRR